MSRARARSATEDAQWKGRLRRACRLRTLAWLQHAPCAGWCLRTGRQRVVMGLRYMRMHRLWLLKWRRYFKRSMATTISGSEPACVLRCYCCCTAICSTVLLSAITSHTLRYTTQLVLPQSPRFLRCLDRLGTNRFVWLHAAVPKQ